MSKAKYYNIWIGIIERCCNPDSKSFPDYGGRGIVLHSKFVRSYKLFEKYLDSLGEREEGYSLDRIDVNRGYVEGNLRWASPKEQANNIRSNSNVSKEREIRFRKARLRLAGRR